VQRRDFLKITLATPALGQLPAQADTNAYSDESRRTVVTELTINGRHSRSHSMPVPRCWIRCAINSGSPEPRRAATTGSAAPARCSLAADASYRA